MQEDVTEPASIAPWVNSAIALTLENVACRDLQSLMYGTTGEGPVLKSYWSGCYKPTTVAFHKPSLNLHLLYRCMPTHTAC